jgi:hypothetical protein
MFLTLVNHHWKTTNWYKWSLLHSINIKYHKILLKYFKRNDGMIQEYIIIVQNLQTCFKKLHKSGNTHTHIQILLMAGTYTLQHTNNCKPKMNVYWRCAVSMCGHEQTLFHRNDTWSDPCVCSNGASGIHDYGMLFHRFHSRI